MPIQPIASMVDHKKNTIGGYDRYTVEDGVRTLQRAKELNSDPGLMKAIEGEASRQADALRGIAKEKKSTPRELRGHGADGI